MSNLKELDWYEDLAADLFDNPDNEKARDTWEKIDKMSRCELEIDPAIVALIGEGANFATPLVSDSIKAIKRFLGGRLPVISVMPMLPSSAEKERMEYLEDALYWHFVLMNKRNAESVHSQITGSAAKYGAVAFQTRYIPFEKKRKSGKKDLYDERAKKEMSRYGDFDWVPHHPSNVYPVWGNGVLGSATAMFTRSVWDVIKEYGEDSPAVKKLLKYFKSDYGASDLRSNYVSFFDHTGCYDRVVWMSFNGTSSELETGGKAIEITRTEHERGFVNWVIKDNHEPIMGSIVDAKTYEHLGQARAIAFSKWLEYAEQKNDVYNAPNPQDPNIVSDEATLGSAEILPSNVTHTRLQPSPPDPAVLTIMNSFENELAMSAGVTPLLNLSQAASATQGNFSSMNAIQSTAVVQLSPVQALIERGEEEGVHQMCRWIYESKESTTGYLRKSRGDTMGKTAGMPVVIAGDNNSSYDQRFQNLVLFDPQDIFISIKLSPASIQDKQAAAALALQQQQAGYSRATSLEISGVDNVDLELSQRAEEMLFEGKIAGDVARTQAEAEAEIIVQNAKRMAEIIMQEAQAKMQQAQQPPPQQPAQAPENAQRAARNPQSPQKGQDSRFAGASPAQQGAPNRVQANGQDDTGAALT